MEGINHVRELLKNWFREANLKEKENDIFFVNTCHICHSLEQEKSLQRCSSCQMISYCGSEHQAKHWPSHKKLCKTVKEIISQNGFSSIFGKTKGISNEDWVKVKMNAMLIVSLKLGRNLTPSEKNMFKFPRSCCICHETNPKFLKNCQFCGNSSFCEEHVSDPTHKKLCPAFIFSYNLDLLKSFTDKIPIFDLVSILLNSKTLDFVPSSQKIVKLTSMREFLETNFKKIIDTRRGTSRPEFWQFFISDYYTRPLTLLSACEILNFEPDQFLTIHLLGSNFLELNGIFAWEIIFHLVPKMQRLKIILIGPEINNDEISVFLCDNCHFNEKVLTVESYNGFYHNFESDCANLIIGYNLGISEFENPGSINDSWRLTILKIAERQVPFILTSYTEQEARKEHERMCYFLGNSARFSAFCQNEFASLKPIRDFESEGVFYQNNYLTVYENFEKVEK